MRGLYSIANDPRALGSFVQDILVEKSLTNNGRTVPNLYHARMIPKFQENEENVAQ